MPDDKLDIPMYSAFHCDFHVTDYLLSDHLFSRELDEFGEQMVDHLLSVASKVRFVIF